MEGALTNDGTSDPNTPCDQFSMISSTVQVMASGSNTTATAQPPAAIGTQAATKSDCPKPMQASEQRHKYLTTEDRKVQPRNEADRNALSFELTTPPHTPPHDQSPMATTTRSTTTTTEPVNGNRNNLSDSALASFKDARNHQEIVSTSGGIRVQKQQRDESKYSSRGYSRVDSEPPALVIVDDSAESQNLQEPRETSSVNKSRGEQDSTEGSHRSSGTDSGPIQVQKGHVMTDRVSSHSTKMNSPVGQEGSGSLVQKLTPVDGQRDIHQSHHEDNPSSSESEEMEEMDLVLVEDESEIAEMERQKNNSDEISRSAFRSNQSSDAIITTVPPRLASGGGAGGGAGGGGTSAGSNVTKKGNLIASKGHHHHQHSAQTQTDISRVNGEKEQMRKILPPTSQGRVVASTTAASERSGRFASERKSKNGAASFVNVKQAAKVKQFFTTIQQHGNKISTEVAEQVQELIHALMNGTATVEEFHQEIQTITNYPLKEFIIPFLRDNIEYLRAELKESSQVLSDILGEVPTTAPLTRQFMDDELPVLPPSSAKTPSIHPPSSIIKTSSVPSIRSINNSVMAASASKTTTTSTRTQVPHSATASNGTVQTHSHANGTGGTPTHSRSHAGGTPTQSHSHNTFISVEDGVSERQHAQSYSSGGGGGVVTNSNPNNPRKRRFSAEHGQVMSVEREGNAEKPWPSKRLRPEFSENAVITNHRVVYAHHPPPPMTHSSENHTVYANFPPPPEHFPPGVRRRGAVLGEDWGHIDMMLSSIQGMVERTRQSMAVLKDRVSNTHTEMERKEMERDSIAQQRINEAVDKIKRQSTEEKQRLLIEASKQLRDAVATVKVEMEGKIQQAQAMAVQEALKETNMQSTSKENCWNCGRRATETCSGCNKARYCGTFCQHKDWSQHMHQCASGVQQEEPAYNGAHEPNRGHHRHQTEVLIPSNRIPQQQQQQQPPQQQHQRIIAIPVNLIGSSPQEVTMRLAQGNLSSQGHPEIFIKTERTA